MGHILTAKKDKNTIVIDVNLYARPVIDIIVKNPVFKSAKIDGSKIKFKIETGEKNEG